jgi:hypothetical protein
MYRQQQQQSQQEQQKRIYVMSLTVTMTNYPLIQLTFHYIPDTPN